MMFKSDLPREVFRERLRTYLFGVAIGLILMGFVLYSANKYRRQKAAEIGTPPGISAPAGVQPGQPPSPK